MKKKNLKGTKGIKETETQGTCEVSVGSFRGHLLLVVMTSEKQDIVLHQLGDYFYFPEFSVRKHFSVDQETVVTELQRRHCWEGFSSGIGELMKEISPKVAKIDKVLLKNK